jgi:thymidine kinase
MFLEEFPNQPKTHGWIEVICGSMFSGKTEELLRRLKRAQIAQQSILTIKPAVDNRYSEDNILTHEGSSIKAISAKSSQEIKLLWKNETIVAIDEAQFFDSELPAVCSELANLGTRVIIAGLDMDFEGKPFGAMPQLLAMAEYVTKVHAICVKCGNLAQFSNRITQDKELVLLGALNSYEPLCRSCFNSRDTKYSSTSHS